MTKPSSASSVTFRPFDDLFEPTDSSSEKGMLTELPVDSLIPFEKHPFREYPEEQMQEMVDSVSQYGVLMPIARLFVGVIYILRFVDNSALYGPNIILLNVHLPKCFGGWEFIKRKNSLLFFFSYVAIMEHKTITIRRKYKWHIHHTSVIQRLLHAV